MKVSSILPEMTNRDRRALAVGAVSIAAMIAFVKVVPSLRRWDDRLELRQALLTRQVSAARQLLGHDRAMRDSLSARSRALEGVEVGLLRAESKSAAEAALASLVSATAAAAGVKIDALALDADVDDGVELVTVSGGATGDIAGVAQFISALEAERARLALRSMSIRPSDVATVDTRAESLRLEFTVQAQVRTAARSVR
ncbi:MAG TPA: GspMb/PilO family protein [Gemmatimonadaceae bacterium]|nr:GspMb/PilO family protein [Gemmatimonadaceae bacterium]